MLEIILMIRISARIRDMAKAKGYKGNRKRWEFVAAWIVAELAGAVVGATIFGEGLGIYIFALIGAAVGARAYYKYVERLPKLKNSSGDYI